ncbi:MAG TPA: GNAT family N-acetyltransferase [Ornithinimicrobium sp.]|nr:GNAT family N-acetyltransferase [Ornithinimicrobium sp.]
MVPDPISPDTARRSTFDDGCTVWHLVDRADLSVVQESVPARSETRTHAHDRSREYFHVLSGRAVVSVGPQTAQVEAGSGIEVPPRVRHQIRNETDEELLLLVVSAPKVTTGRHSHRARPLRRDYGGVVVGTYLRPTRVGDLDVVVEIESAQDTGQWLGEGGREWHEQVLQDPDKEHWVLVDRLDRVVAFGILAALDSPDEVELRRMVVAPEGRGQGLGRLLLRKLLEQAAGSPQVKRVWLDVGADNTRARSLYRTFGFVEREAPPGAILLENGLYMEWCPDRH